MPRPVHTEKPLSMVNLAVLSGSSREGRFCDTIGDWLTEQLKVVPDFTLDLLDPLHLNLPERYERDDGPAMKAYQARIALADAFVVLTPEYNHGYPAALKHLIDAAMPEWRAKPVGFVSYGGISGGLRAIEQLRLVFAELSAIGLRDTVSFHNPWRSLDSNGRLLGSPEAISALNTLIDQLRWWAVALKTAREQIPFPKVTHQQGASGESHE